MIEIDSSWEQIFKYWTWKIEECGYPEELFVDINFEHPDADKRYDGLEWWPKNQLETQRQKCIDWWVSRPDSRGPVRPFDLGKGPLYTLENLWFCRDSLETQAAVLLTAILFPYVESSRKVVANRTDFGLTFKEVRDVYYSALEVANTSEHFEQWGITCNHVLPPYTRLHSVCFETVQALIGYLAERHCMLLNEYQPVRLTFGEPKNEFSPNRYFFI